MSICSNLFGNLRRAGGGDEREREKQKKRERNTVRNFTVLKTIFDYMNRLSRTDTGRIIISVFSVDHLSHLTLVLSVGKH